MIAKVFYSLNYQDLPEFFEDNMTTWFENFMVMLKFDAKELHTAVSMLTSSVFTQAHLTDYGKFVPLLIN